MKVSQKAGYALRAMLELALGSPGRQMMRTAEIAQRSGIPEKFLEAVFVELRKAGLVTSRRGPEGGHGLALPAADITVAAIREATDGPLCLAPNVATEGRSGSADQVVQRAWSSVEHALQTSMAAITLEELRNQVNQKRNVIDYTI